MLMRYYWHCNLSNLPSHYRLPCSPCPPMTQSRSDTRMRHSMPSFDIFSSRHLNLAVRGKIDDRNRHDLRCSTFDDRYWSQGKPWGRQRYSLVLVVQLTDVLVGELMGQSNTLRLVFDRLTIHYRVLELLNYCLVDRVALEWSQ